MTALIDISAVKNLRLANDLCRAISKLINNTVSNHQSMSSSSDKQIYPNSKLQTQVEPRKFHETNKLQSKRKAPSFNTFEEKEAFVKNYIKCKSLSCKHRQWKSKSFLKMTPPQPHSLQKNMVRKLKTFHDLSYC